MFKDDDSIKRLAEYLGQLVGSEKIDVILTKPWKKENLEKYIDQLSNIPLHLLEQILILKYTPKCFNVYVELL